MSDFEKLVDDTYEDINIVKEAGEEAATRPNATALATIPAVLAAIQSLLTAGDATTLNRIAAMGQPAAAPAQGDAVSAAQVANQQASAQAADQAARELDVANDEYSHLR